MPFKPIVLLNSLCFFLLLTSTPKTVSLSFCRKMRLRDILSLDCETHQDHLNLEIPPMDNVKTCWICFESSSDVSHWIEPCRCIGSTRWVHHSCLSQWIDRAEQSSSDSANNTSETTPMSFFSLLPSALRRQPVCPQCRTPYTIHTSKHSLLFTLEYSKYLYNRLLVATTAVGLASSLYLVAFSYGYGACSAVCGSEEFSGLIREHLSRSIDANNTQQEFNHHLVGSPVDLTRGAFIGRLFVGLPLIPVAILSASFNHMHWLYPTIPALMLFGDRHLQLGWPPSDRLVVCALPLVLRAYRYLRQHLYDWVSRRMARGFLRGELETRARDMLRSSIGSFDLETFIRETAGSSDNHSGASSDDERTIGRNTSEHRNQSSTRGTFSTNTNSHHARNGLHEIVLASNSTTNQLHNPIPESLQITSDDIFGPTSMIGNADTSDNENEPATGDEDIRVILHIKRIMDTLLIPFVGSALGRLMFRSSTMVTSKFHRSMIGIGLFIVVTDGGCMLARYWKVKSRLGRRILDYPKAA